MLSLFCRLHGLRNGAKSSAIGVEIVAIGPVKKVATQNRSAAGCGIVAGIAPLSFITDVGMQTKDCALRFVACERATVNSKPPLLRSTWNCLSFAVVFKN